MANILLPTSKAQVSGYKFLMRRAQHGVVLGDIRMIHDPLARRHRALYAGAAMATVLGLGAGAMAVMNPAINPGEAPIVASESGALYVRIDATLHPVTNLASARLITGEATQPVRASDAVLATIPRGVPVGIPDAPGMIAPEPPGDTHWSACHHEAGVLGALPHVSVQVGHPAEHLRDNEALVAEVAGHFYLVTNKGRAQLPAENTPEGRVIRRRLGITPDVFVWRPPRELLNVIAEQPPLHIPNNVREVLVSDGGAWVRYENGIQPITSFQHDILRDANIKETRVNAGILAEHPDAPPAPITLPTEPLTLIHLRPESRVCATDADGVVSVDAEDLVDDAHSTQPRRGVALSGDNLARTYVGPGTGLGVDSGHGYFVVSDTGMTHRVASHEELEALGVRTPATAPWSIIRLLPSGSQLAKKQAMLPTY